MPRGPRLDAPGVLHHVMGRGIDRQVIYRDDRDRNSFLDSLSRLAWEKAWVVYAWALIPNHFHLLVRTARVPLPRVMRRLMTGYAGYFNRRHSRSGHVFQNRYKSIVAEEETYFVELVRYLHLNPLRGGLVRTLEELDRYPYSGHSALMGETVRPWQETSEVLGRFARGAAEARRRYRAFVEEGILQGRRPDLMGGGLVRSVGGWEEVKALRRGREAFRSDERVLGSSRFVEGLMKEVQVHSIRRGGIRRSNISLDALCGRIEKELGLAPGDLRTRSREGKVSKGRSLLAYVWTELLGRSGRGLAREIGVTPGAICQAAQRGAEKAERWEERMAKWIE